MPDRLDVQGEATCRLNVVERLGLQFLRRRLERRASQVHAWSPAELSKIQCSERLALAIASATGAVSGGVLGALEIGVRWWLIGAGEAAGWWEQLPYWAVFLAVAVLVSGAEILFLYWIVLRVAARISAIAGLRLADEGAERVIAAGLSRAALDLPNPRAPVYGIDPYARVPRWKLLAYTVLYRLKIGMTSFVLRILLRRVLARAALRTFIPLIGIPVFAVWNGLITWWVLREIRVRAAGPEAVEEIRASLSANGAHLNEASRRLILEGVAEAMIRSGDAHPNFVLLLTHLLQDLGISPDSLKIDWDTSRAGLKDLDRESQDVLLTALSVAAVLAGRPRSAQIGLLDEAHAVCGRPFQEQALFDLHREFTSGHALGGEHANSSSSRSAE